jgi:pSer/pThr/pTyr-binding forkhead associated (FHA) protein
MAAVAAARAKGLASTSVDVASPLTPAPAPVVAAPVPSVPSPQPFRAPAPTPPLAVAPPLAAAPTPMASADSPSVAGMSVGASAPVTPSAASEDPESARRFGATKPLRGLSEATTFARLVQITKEGNEGSVFLISSETTDIGRTEGHIVLGDDPYLSPRHARITVRATSVGAPLSISVVDLGSVNGVFVRLRAPRILQHGDLLLLGQQVLRFEAVTDIEGARGPAMQHGVLLFGSPAPIARARLSQRTVEGLVRDVLYLVRDEVVLGRETGDRTFPDDQFLSRRHCAVRREASGFSVVDLGSSNGTFVDVHGEQRLEHGDQLRIGHHLFRIDIPQIAGAHGASGGGALDGARGSA